MAANEVGGVCIGACDRTPAPRDRPLKDLGVPEPGTYFPGGQIGHDSVFPGLSGFSKIKNCRRRTATQRGEASATAAGCLRVRDNER